MPYSEALAARVRTLLDKTPGLTEKKMFGGVGWMINGNMAVGAHSDGRLMVRCAKEDTADYTEEDGCNPMHQGGRAMRGWLLVDADVAASDSGLKTWVDRGRAFAQSLPAK